MSPGRLAILADCVSTVHASPLNVAAKPQPFQVEPSFSRCERGGRGDAPNRRRRPSLSIRSASKPAPTRYNVIINRLQRLDSPDDPAPPNSRAAFVSSDQESLGT